MHNVSGTVDTESCLPNFTQIGSKSSTQILQWSSSGPSQKSYFDRNKLSFFTHSIIRGLCSAQTSCTEGAAPECRSCTKFFGTCWVQGCVQLFPLMEYVHDHVQECALNKNREPQQTSTKGKFSKDIPIAHYSTERLCYFIDVNFKDLVFSVMLLHLPDDVNHFKHEVMEQVRDLYSSSVTLDMSVKIHNDGKVLNNMDEIKQIFQLSTTISAEILSELEAK